MGISVSVPRQVREDEDIWWTNGNREPTNQQIPSSEETENLAVKEDVSLNFHSEKSKQKFNDLMFDMERKHEKRREILAAKKKQFEDLRDEVRRLTEENEQLKNLTPTNSQEEIEQLEEENKHLRLLLSSKQSSGVLMEELDKVLRENSTLKGELKDKIEELAKAAALLDKNRELKISIAEMQGELQNLNSVVVDFEKEREEYKAHVVALKDVITVSKKMLLIREAQLKELRQKVESIEESLSGKEMNILSQDLRLEYERQLQSIRNLRTLYEERQRSDHREKEEFKKVIEELKKELEDERNKNKEAEERINELEEINSQKYDQVKSLESNLGLSKAEVRQYQAELTVINQMFSEILLGFNNSQEIDLDKLTKHLEDHHELLQSIVKNEISPETSFALPKVLLNLVNQVHTEEENKNAYTEENQDGGRLETIVEESESQTSTQQINSAEEIVELLPKVWRVLIELLSHQRVPVNLSTEGSTDEHPCYKTVETPKGPNIVLSVSQTFIRLKDLILEKKALEKETGHLKQLNTHLENRLQDQEKRLGMVTSELNKTWHMVGNLQKQHQLLHTQEKILRYELAQKRKLLTTLKEELEYSREKWQEAREKNSKTEKQWRQLRVEFASRRTVVASDECSTSGYSDERCSSSDDEPGYESEELESSKKQRKDAEEVEEDEVIDNACDTETTSLDEPTDDDQEVTPVSTHIEGSLSEDTVQDRVSISKKFIELANTSIEAKLTRLDEPTDSGQEVIPVPTQIEERSLSEDRVTMAEESIELANTSIEAQITGLDEPIDDDQEVTPVPTHRNEGPLLENTVQDRVRMVEKSIEMTNTSIKAKLTRLDEPTNHDREGTPAPAHIEERSFSEDRAARAEPSILSIEAKVTRLDELTDDNQEVTPVPTHIDEGSLSEDTVQDRVTMAEESIKLANTSIEAKLQTDRLPHSELSSNSSSESSSSKEQTTSSCVVSSVIEEAIAAILKNSLKENKELPTPSNQEDVPTENKTCSTEDIVQLPEPVEGTAEPCTSNSTESKSKTLEERLAAKEERLKRLEGQCEQLVQKVTNTTQKSVMISNKLDDLHEVYSESPTSSQTPKGSTAQENFEVNRPSDDNQE